MKYCTSVVARAAFIYFFYLFFLFEKPRPSVRDWLRDDVLANVSTLIGEWFIRLPISRGGPRRAVAGKHNHLPWSDLTEGEGVCEWVFACCSRTKQYACEFLHVRSGWGSCCPPVIGCCPFFVSLRLFLINQRHVELREDNQLALRRVPAVNDVDQGEKLAAILTRFRINSMILRRKLTGTGCQFWLFRGKLNLLGVIDDWITQSSARLEHVINHAILIARVQMCEISVELPARFSCSCLRNKACWLFCHTVRSFTPLKGKKKGTIYTVR